MQTGARTSNDCRIVTALGRTIELEEAIDRLYPEVEAHTVPFASAG